MNYFERELLCFRDDLIIIYYDFKVLKNLFACLNSYLAQFNPETHRLLVSFGHAFEDEEGLRWGAAPDGSTVVLDPAEKLARSAQLSIELTAIEQDVDVGKKPLDQAVDAARVARRMDRQEEILSQLATAAKALPGELKERLLLPTVLLLLLVLAAFEPAFQTVRRFFGF